MSEYLEFDVRVLLDDIFTKTSLCNTIPLTCLACKGRSEKRGS